MRAQLMRQQIQEARAREQLYGAETEWNRARTARETALAQQTKDEALQAALQNKQFGSAVRQFFSTMPGVMQPDPTSMGLGDIAATLPGASTTSNPDQLAKAIQAFALMQSSGALKDPTTAMMFNAGRDPIATSSRGWANVLTGQGGKFPEDSAAGPRSELLKAETELTKARTEAVKKGKAAPSDTQALRSWAQIFTKAFTDSGDVDDAVEIANTAMGEFLKAVGKPKDAAAVDENATPQKPAPDASGGTTGTNAPVAAPKLFTDAKGKKWRYKGNSPNPLADQNLQNWEEVP